MNNEQLDERIAATAPNITSTLSRPDLYDAQQALLAEIVGSASTDARPDARPRRSTGWLVAAAAVVVLLAAGLPAYFLGPMSGPAPLPYSAQAKEMAANGPKVLLDLPGWRVQNLGTDGDDEGSISWAKGRQRLELDWRPAQRYAGYAADRAHIGPATSVDVLGTTGTMYRYAPGDFTVLLPPRDGTSIEVRGGVGNRAHYLAVLAHLQQVSADRWLAAMPASIVRPDEAGMVADRMLADMPLPPAFDRARLSTDDASDSYQFGARVSGAVVCGWIADYRSGDLAERARAVAALESSKHWRVLHRMDRQGDWPEVIWDIADQIEAGRLDPPSTYRHSIGCPD